MTTSPTILVVDDEPANRLLLEAILKPEGYTTRSVEDAPTALPLIAHGDVDLVLLDVMMPKLDGISACRMIREDLKQPLLPVVLITALHDNVSRARGKEAGADDFITKPVYEEELLARVRTLLRLREYQQRVDEQRILAEHEARRWRIVSRVAQQVSAANDVDAVRACLVAALGDDLRVEAPMLARVADDTALSLPLGHAGDDYLVLRPQSGERFDINDAELLASLVPHLANAIARVRLAETRGAIQAAQERLMRFVVHDLKNPLSVIRFNVDFLRNAIGQPDLADAADDALAAARQLNGMLLDLLDIGLAEDGRLPFNPAPGDLGLVVSTAATGFRAVIEGRGARLELRVDSRIPPLVFDAALIMRVLQNLLVNASRFVPAAGGVVEVAVNAERDAVVISVGNNGPALAPDVRERLFDKYAQTNDTQGAANRGLGLYLCRLVAERHGGFITAVDRAGGGVRFDVSLPLERK